MNIKNNQRAQNTQKKIKDVFVELLGSKGISQISVQEICRRAGVNRTTFYSHFEDVYDLLRKIEKEKEQAVYALFMDPETKALNRFTESNLEKLIEFVQANADFYRVYLNYGNTSLAMDRGIAASWEQHIAPVVSLLPHQSDMELWYRFEYFKSGFTGVIKKWLNTDCRESPAELTAILKKCLPVGTDEWLPVSNEAAPANPVGQA